jgi:predicted nucleic acid-binding protein
MVLDNNVLLSGIACPASVPGKILAAWRHGSVDVLLSAYLLDELRRVLPRLAATQRGRPALIGGPQQCAVA